MLAATQIRDLLALTLTDGLGPVLIRRLLDSMGGPAAVLDSPLAALKTIRGIGDAKAATIHASLKGACDRSDAELALAERLGVSLLALGEAAYPPLLAQIPDAPPILYFRGSIITAPPADGLSDRYPVAIVGSRSCTPYGVEQAERFAGHFASCGLTVVSGGARGIDTAAHRSALRNAGRTIAVLGCGLAHCYPEDNAELFGRIADGRGAVISELPLATIPSAENFPARNRIISGLALGVVVIEAGRGSGALLTARAAAEDHGREVFALPGRVDSPASQGSLDLIKAGGALLVTEPADVVTALESPARHLHHQTHAARYAAMTAGVEAGLFQQPDPPSAGAAEPLVEPALGLSPTQSRILEALAEPLTADQLCTATGLDPGSLRADLTFLELNRCITRVGSRLARTRRR